MKNWNQKDINEQIEKVAAIRDLAFSKGQKWFAVPLEGGGTVDYIILMENGKQEPVMFVRQK
jgi:hypothetical protein